MVASHAHRERRNVLAAWLNDRFGGDLVPGEGCARVPDVVWWRDAVDLLRFIEANGFQLDPPEDYRDAPFPADHGHPCTCSPSWYDGDDGWDRKCPEHGVDADAER